MRWLILSSLLFLTPLLLCGEGAARQPGELILPKEFKANDYPNDAGDKILLVWSASAGDNTKMDEVDKKFKSILEERLDAWRQEIASVVGQVQGISDVIPDIEFELLKRVVSKAKATLLEEVDKEPKIVYEVYSSEKPKGERLLIGRFPSNDSSYLHKSEPKVFCKHPAEPLAHFFKVNVVDVFCKEEAKEIGRLKSSLASQLQMKDRAEKAKDAIDGAVDAHLKDRATFILLHKAKRDEKAEDYNAAYWMDVLMEEMKLLQQLGKEEKRLLDISPVDEESLKSASVGGKLVLLQRAFENACISSGRAYSSGEFGYYILSAIDRKLSEIESLVELEAEETQKRVDDLRPSRDKAVRRNEVLKKLHEVTSQAKACNELKFVVDEMFRESEELKEACEDELSRKGSFEEKLETARKRLASFLSVKDELVERIDSAIAELRRGTRVDVSGVKKRLRSAQDEFAKAFAEFVGAVLLYRYIADGDDFMKKNVIKLTDEEVEKIKNGAHEVGSELAFLAAAVERLYDSLQPPAEQAAYPPFTSLKGWLVQRYNLVSEQQKALNVFAKWLGSVGKQELVGKARKAAEKVKKRYDALIKEWVDELRKKEKSLEQKRDKVYYFHLAMCRLGADGKVVERKWHKDVVSASAVSNWFNTNKINNLLMAILLGVLVFYFISYARRNPKMFIRKISGLDAVDEAVGRATEMGKPVFYLTGLQPMSNLSTIASINILSRVSRKIAQHDTRLRVPCCDPIVMSVAQEVYKEAATAVGRPDAFKEDDIFFVTRAQFAYAAAVDGMMVREKPGAIFLMGYFFAESLILAETGSTTGAIQIAGTDAYVQIPFFITTCDYTLIGEELYAASAYLSREPMLLGSLRGQDIGKAVFIVAIIVGTVFAVLGSDLVQLLFIEY